MIIRKPYAFLIKNFRIIHAILFGLQVYILVKSSSIYNFFNDYAVKHYYVKTYDLVSNYMDLFLFIIVILSIGLGAAIFYLLNVKRKPNKYYLIQCFYYFVILIYLFVVMGILQGLQTEIMEVESIRAIRDVSVIILLPQLIFMFISLGRALGFNVRQFDFKRDLNELEIDTTDYEEVEVNLGKNNYKYARFFRKRWRYFKYFVLENKFYVVLISSIACFIISVVIFLNLRVYSVTYSQNQEILANSLWFTASNTYITNEDVYGDIIDKNTYFLITKVKIDNKGNTDLYIEKDAFELKVKDSLLMPNLTLTDKFIDVGVLFRAEKISSGASKEYIVVFNLTKKQVYDEYTLRIKNSGAGGIINLKSAYKDVIVRPINLIAENDLGTYYLPNEVSFNKTILGDSKMLISSYKIADYFEEKYSNCTDDKCYDGTYIIKPSVVNKKDMSVLKIKTTIDIEKDSYIESVIKKPADLFKYYVDILYRYQGVVYKGNVTILPNEFETDK